MNTNTKLLYPTQHNNISKKIHEEIQHVMICSLPDLTIMNVRWSRRSSEIRASNHDSFVWESRGIHLILLWTLSSVRLMALKKVGIRSCCLNDDLRIIVHLFIIAIIIPKMTSGDACFLLFLFEFVVWRTAIASKKLLKKIYCKNN